MGCAQSAELQQQLSDLQTKHTAVLQNLDELSQRNDDLGETVAQYEQDLTQLRTQQTETAEANERKELVLKYKQEVLQKMLAIEEDKCRILEEKVEALKWEMLSSGYMTSQLAAATPTAAQTSSEAEAPTAQAVLDARAQHLSMGIDKVLEQMTVNKTGVIDTMTALSNVHSSVSPELLLEALQHSVPKLTVDEAVAIVCRFYDGSEVCVMTLLQFFQQKRARKRFKKATAAVARIRLATTPTHRQLLRRALLPAAQSIQDLESVLREHRVASPRPVRRSTNDGDSAVSGHLESDTSSENGVNYVVPDTTFRSALQQVCRDMSSSDIEMLTQSFSLGDSIDLDRFLQSAKKYSSKFHAQEALSDKTLSSSASLPVLKPAKLHVDTTWTPQHRMQLLEPTAAQSPKLAPREAMGFVTPVQAPNGDAHAKRSPQAVTQTAENGKGKEANQEKATKPAENGTLHQETTEQDNDEVAPGTPSSRADSPFKQLRFNV